MRGEADEHALRNLGIGITPACAGRSFARSFYRSCQKDHPRVCGEKTAAHTGKGCTGGSPPRVRGEADALFADMMNMGITPACAGRSDDA